MLLPGTPTLPKIYRRKAERRRRGGMASCRRGAGTQCDDGAQASKQALSKGLCISEELHLELVLAPSLPLVSC